MPRATVKRFHDAKGYGFLVGDDGREVLAGRASWARTHGPRELGLELEAPRRPSAMADVAW